jgi:hypothetical protein
MRTILLSLLAAVLAAGPAAGQNDTAGEIAVFSDEDHSSCEFTGEGFVQVHVFHIGTNKGATAAQFKLYVPDSWTHLGDRWNFDAVIGSSAAGVSIGYGECRPSPVYLGLCTFQTLGDAPCTPVWVGPAPDAPSGRIEAVDCKKPANKVFPAGACGYVNPTDSCRCVPGEVECPPLPEATTPDEAGQTGENSD